MRGGEGGIGVEKIVRVVGVGRWRVEGIREVRRQERVGKERVFWSP